MDNLLNRTHAAQKLLLDVSRRLSQGPVPGIYEILELCGELNNLYFEVAMHQSQMFGEKEKSYILRKIRQAQKTREFRKDLNVADSTIKAIDACEKHYMNEVEAMKNYEQCKLLLRSLDNALNFARSLKTSIDKMENHTI